MELWLWGVGGGPGETRTMPRVCLILPGPFHLCEELKCVKATFFMSEWRLKVWFIMF